MGYSSLAQLERFPIDALKIDRSFVSRMSREGGKTLEIVRSIVDLARNLRIDVTAEGVETNETLAQIVELGCNKIQGWLYSKAVPAAELDLIIQKQPFRRPSP
jgi:EAL domain-containing protein (putative c-di-GMP-specific phosphodiesterase class I)